VPVLTIRDVPVDLLRSLKALAVRNRRSLQQQVLTLLEQVRVLDLEAPSERAAAMRNRLAGRELGDTVADVRGERER
jgi:hypothetical protein